MRGGGGGSYIRRLWFLAPHSSIFNAPVSCLVLKNCRVCHAVCDARQTLHANASKSQTQMHILFFLVQRSKKMQKNVGLDDLDLLTVWCTAKATAPFAVNTLWLAGSKKVLQNSKLGFRTDLMIHLQFTRQV